MVLRHHARAAIPGPESNLQHRDLRLGDDPGTGANRKNPLEDFPVRKGPALYRAHQSQRPAKRKSRAGGPGDDQPGSGLAKREVILHT